MKKRKITYSLTAQQKKSLKKQQSGEATVEESTAESVAAKNRVNYKLIICIAAAVLAVAMIVLAIFIPVWTAEVVTHDTFLNWRNYNSSDPDNPYTDENPNPNPTANPIATITLTGDDDEAFKQIFGAKQVKLTVELFMDDAPYAGMNFMYLAESGYFDDTIISDVYRGRAMFCGYTGTTNGENKAQKGNLIRNLKGFVENNVSSWNTDKYKLGYRLSTESSRSVADTSQDALGYLLMMAGSSSYYSTSTAFMFTTRSDPQYNFSDSSTAITTYASWLGRVTNDESMNVLSKIDGITTTLNGKSYCPDTTIKISSITTNLSSARKGYLLENYESLLQDGLSISTWRKVAYNETYFGFAN